MTATPKVTMGIAIPPKPPIASVRAMMWAARLARLDSVMVWDHLQDFYPTALWDRSFTWLAAGRPSPHEFYDFQTLLGALAPRAGRLRLGVAVTEPVRRHPVVIAQAMLTLAHLTTRPPILGIGAGERENIEPYGLDFSRPVGRLDEALQIIRRCFDGESPLTFAGDHYQLDHAPFDLRPPSGRVPDIWIGGTGPRMLRLTGQYGDGWYPVGMMPPSEYATKLAAIHAAARAAGRDPAAITPALQPYLIIAPTEREARAMLQTRLVRFYGLLVPAESWRRVGLAHPFGEAFRGYVDFLPERYTRAELDAAIAAVPPDLAGEVGLLWGTPEQVSTQLRAYIDAGVRYLVPQPVSAALSRRSALYSLRALRTIAKEIGGA